MNLYAAVLSVLLCSVHSFTIQASIKKNDEDSGTDFENDNLSVSTLLERANRNIGKNLDDPLVMFGDIAMPTGLQNADPCVTEGCLWPKASDGKVYVPYKISRQYTEKQRNTIIQGLQSFAVSTCIRFTPLNGQKDFLDIQSDTGCYSYVGRRGSGQVLSLNNRGCVYHKVIQHELLHALGFHHEQNRSDRDLHVRILLQNVSPGQEHNFDKINTINLGTPYDYNSVMQYERDAFSKNGKPTIIPIPNSKVAIGLATRMSSNDILRVNRLYRCNTPASRPDLEPIRNKHFL